MKIIYFALILCCISISQAYLLSNDDYFYINSSYARGVVTVSMNFRINNLKQVKLEGLFGRELNGASGKVVQGKLIDFGGAFNEQKVGYNNYDSGQYWFSFKHQMPGITLPSFFPLNLTLVHEDVINLELLLPLFSMPLSAFPISSMSLCYESALISYVYGFGVEDLLLVSQDGKWEASEHQDWGFWQNQGAVSYFRYKRKGNGHLKVKNQHKQCKLSSQMSKNTLKIDKNPITLKQLLKYDIPNIQNTQSDL